MKKLLCALLTVILTLSGVSALAEDKVTLVYAELNPIENTIVGQMAMDFKTKVEELSSGSIIIDIRANGVMGSEAQLLNGIQMGDTAVDVARISAFALSNYGCTRATLLSLPYTFASREHFWNFARSDLARQFLLEPQYVGLPLRGICYGEEGFRHFFFKDAVESIEDVRGKRIRISEDTVMPNFVRALGASAVGINFTELKAALRGGVCDGAEQPIVDYMSNDFQKVAPYLLLDGHTLGAIELIITDNAWNKLSEQQQEWIMEAGEYASEMNAEKSVINEEEILEQLRAEGVRVIEVEDKSPWIEVCADIIASNMNGNRAIYQQILDMQ